MECIQLLIAEIGNGTATITLDTVPDGKAYYVLISCPFIEVSWRGNSVPYLRTC